MALLIESSGRCLRTRGAEIFDGEPGDGEALVDGGLAEGFTEVAFSGPGRPADAEVLPPLHPFQGAQRALGGPRDAAVGLVPDVEGLAGRERRSPAAGAQGGRVTAGGFLGEEHPDEFGRVPALRLGGRDDLLHGFAQVGHP
jgi:hypothetical protein